jgi:hypothetical protein
LNKLPRGATFLYMHRPERQHPERHYYGERFASQVVCFLNDDAPKSDQRKYKAARKRILSLLEMLRPVVFGEICYFWGDRRLPDLFRLNGLLRRYTSCSIVLPSPIYNLPDPRSPERSAFDGKKKPLALRFATGADPFGPAFREHTAANAVVRLAELTSLDSLKTCKHCGLWFFAKFAHQEFCRKECRIKHNSSSDEWKEYKRNKAREYYQLHKSGKVRER